ncbi:MAG: hypothetical protein U1A77_15630 [Pirellulales bacterium]
MVTSHELHLLARDVLEAFAAHSYFRSIRLTNALADRSPTQCVRWTFNLVEEFVNASPPCEVAMQTLSAIRHAIAGPSADDLSELDKLSWKSWCSGSFDEQSLFAQRAVARLGWATILLVGASTKTCFDSAYTGIHISANADVQIREMANQCGMAIDMIYTGTNDGRLMVAASFSREMGAPT